MADQKGVKQRSTGAGAPSHLIRNIVVVLIILAILYLAVTWILNAASVTAISGPTTLAATNSTSFFSLYGNEYSLSLLSASNQSAQVELTQLPTFLNPTLYVNLVLNNATSVSPTLQQNANMQIKYTQLNSKTSIQVSIVPIPVGFTQAPTYSKITVAQTSLAPFGSSVPLATTTISSNSTNSTTTAASTTVASSTTTISQAVTGSAEALAVVQKTPYYGLMLNYSRLYTNGTSCTAPLYNSTFIRVYDGQQPSGGSTYENVTTEVPISLVLNITNTSTSDYVATWKTGFKDGSSSAVVVMSVNVQSSQVTSTSIEGIFSGETYSDLQSGFVTADAVGNDCGIYVG
jgi:hypothetical protein